MKTKLVIECSGGVVTAVYGNKHVEVTLIDWDDVAEGDSPVEMQVAPLSTISEDTRKLITRR